MTNVLNKAIGSYQLIEFIDRDDTTIRYKGFQPSTGRYVTIRVLVPALAADQAFVRQFRQDMRLIARLESPHILPIYDEGQQEGLIYKVTRYPTGDTLRAWRPATQALRQRLNLSRALANALDTIHRQGLIHGNLKPSNILIEPQGRPLLTGFGFAQKIAEINTNTVYMSPDRLPGRAVDQRDDIYALGVILHEILLGEPPTQSTISQPRHNHPALMTEVMAVIRKAIVPDANERYQTAGQLNRALTGALDRAEKSGLPSSNTPPPLPTSIGPDRQWLQFFWGSLGVLCLIVAFNLSFLYFTISADGNSLQPMMIDHQTPPPELPTSAPDLTPEMSQPASTTVKQKGE